MLKNLARKILKKEIGNLSERVRRLSDLTDRQDDIINTLVKENDELSNGKEIRKYVFDIERLNKKEQEVLGKYHDHEVVEVLKKSFKASADENCDKLVHFPEESESKRSQWSLAVRIYDDLVLQLKILSRLG